MFAAKALVNACGNRADRSAGRTGMTYDVSNLAAVNFNLDLRRDRKPPDAILIIGSNIRWEAALLNVACAKGGERGGGGGPPKGGGFPLFCWVPPPPPTGGGREGGERPFPATFLGFFSDLKLLQTASPKELGGERHEGRPSGSGRWIGFGGGRRRAPLAKGGGPALALPPLKLVGQVGS